MEIDSIGTGSYSVSVTVSNGYPGMKSVSNPVEFSVCNPTGSLGPLDLWSLDTNLIEGDELDLMWSLTIPKICDATLTMTMVMIETTSGLENETDLSSMISVGETTMTLPKGEF